MTLDNEEQRKNLLAMVNNTSFKGESAREIVKLIEAIEGAMLVNEKAETWEGLQTGGRPEPVTAGIARKRL